MIRRLSLIVGGVLLALNLWGLFDPNDERVRFGVTMSYAEALAAMDRAHLESGGDYAFVEQATQIYSDAIDYRWPVELAQIPVTDNWILHSLGYLDRIVVGLGLTDVPDLFSAFQSLRYERGFRRGYGICSQNALGLVDLLDRRYAIDARLVGLDGHVILESVLADGPTLHDPSLGPSFPFGLDGIDAVRLDEIRAIYAALGDEGLGRAYDATGNVREPLGVKGYQPRIYYLERIADWLKWIVPLLLVMLGAYPFIRARTSGDLQD